MESSSEFKDQQADMKPADGLSQSSPPVPMHRGWLVGAIIIGVGVIGVLGWFGYRQFFRVDQPTPEQKNFYTGTITIGYTAWPGYLGLYLARDKGFFSAAGVQVELKKYDSLSTLSQAYTNGDIQGKANLSLDAIQEANQGFGHKAIVVIDHSNGADGIIAGSEIHTLPEVKGKKFAFEHGTLEEFLTRYALQQYGLTLADIVPVDLDAEKSAQALLQGTVEVATTYEPFLTQTLAEIQGNKVFSSKEAPQLITDILTFRTDFITQHPDTIQAIVKAYFQGIQFWEEHPEDAHALIAKELGINPDQAVEQLSGLHVLSLRDNVTAFTYAPGLSSLYGNLKEVLQFVTAHQTKAPSVPVDTDSLIEPRFIRKLSE